MSEQPALGDASLVPNNRMEDFCLPPTSTLREVMFCLNRNAKGIVLLVDGDRRLVATITDGDLRRALLAGAKLDTACSEVVWTGRGSVDPITAQLGTPQLELLRLMSEFTVRHIPLLNEQGQVVDVALISSMIDEPELPVAAVVMAGGFGNRMKPLTDTMPKPMLPVGGKPLLQLIVEQLRKAGVRRVNLTTHYRGEVISEYFGDGREFGVQLNYVREDRPLGTAGALSLLDHPKEPLLVINGDIVTHVDFRAMLNFHLEQHADLTVGVREHVLKMPYGVVELDGTHIRGLSEKPLIHQYINAGIYLVDPVAQNYIPADRPYDMTDLIARLIDEGHTVVGFPIHEYWLDIGQLADYEQAIQDSRSGRL